MPKQPSSYGGDEYAVLWLLVELPVPAGAVDAAVFARAGPHVRLHVGERFELHRRRRWWPEVLHQPASELRPNGLRPEGQLRAELYLRVAGGTWPQVHEHGRCCDGAGRMEAVGNYLGGVWYAVHSAGERRHSEHAGNPADGEPGRAVQDIGRQGSQ